ncbi:Pfam:DUF889 [Seminavis robusta]|uniref:Pfam:DUF889 n=1 Tax=Seminavis robusta TaxID=568900 RepID=A0A9N8HNM2_9STRA|nr:Pfam:DUF889 [Seminavis robusta]|eukprot:Sro1098_g240930.1 Pfam:DUF889 (372) ;mRNA; f:4926-6041
MVFAGDFSQLTPPKRDPLYKRECAAFQGTLNAYIELDGMHRFRNDIPWGERLKRFRAGKPTKDDIMYINHHCVVSKNHKPNSNIQVACHYNWERDVVNTTVFQQFCVANAPADADNVYMGAIMILMDSMEMYNDHKQYVPVTSNRIKKHFWTTCGESDCDMDNGRVDPALKMYYNCPLMLTKNEDVPNGQANGSRVFLRKVHVKPGEQPFIIKLHCGVRIRVFRVTQIDRITVKHEMKDMLPRCFDVKTHGVSFKCKMKIEKEKIEVRMKGIQFPLVSNSATTGHKLQGYTASQLLVWNWHYADNWVYVVLSRVREMKGLFLRKPLSLDLTKYQMPDEMVYMLETFSRYIPFDTVSADNYDEMLQSEAAFN